MGIEFMIHDKGSDLIQCEKVVHLIALVYLTVGLEETLSPDF